MITVDRHEQGAAGSAVVAAADMVAGHVRLSRLALGLGGPPRRATQSTPRGLITLATVRDPDGLLVLLTPGSITRRV